MLNKISFIAIVFLTIIFSTVTAFSAEAVKVVGTNDNNHTLVLLSDGTVVGWGKPEHGELGPKAAIPVNARHATRLVSIKLPRKAVDIAVTEYSSFAVLDDGTVVGWGDLLKSETPKRLPNLDGIVKIAGSMGAALALKNDGTVYGFGKTGAFSFEQIPGLENIKEISIGNVGMALDASGNVWTWAVGDNASKYGTLGRETNLFGIGKVEGLTNVVSIAQQGSVSTAVKKDGTVWVWGSNDRAQLANGRKSDLPNRGDASEIVTKPQQVSGIRSAIFAVDGGGSLGTSLVLLKDGTIRGWGDCEVGQIGIGQSYVYIKSPAAPKISNIKAVFTAGANTFAIKNDNTLWMWGADNKFGYPNNKLLLIPQLFELK